jgi:hypothetical protein
VAHKAPTYLFAFKTLDRQVEGTNACASEGITV